SKKREESKEMEKDSSAIEAQIKQLLELKANDVKELEERTLLIKAEETALIGISFYLVQYKSRLRTRTAIYPPVTATSYEQMDKKIRRAILPLSLEARIQLLLSPRSPELNKVVFAKLRKEMMTNSALRASVLEIAKFNDLLKAPDFEEEVVKGMIELEEEGWLNAKEKDLILSIYVKT
ncbi:MAG: hypothetical protein NWF14_06775, partial [Candidatus Bathyarchaeota archaeon]|nr:hypothetical protein [Candidatus Bathyarchaeota archaeon]